MGSGDKLKRPALDGRRGCCNVGNDIRRPWEAPTTLPWRGCLRKYSVFTRPHSASTNSSAPQTFPRCAASISPLATLLIFGRSPRRMHSETSFRCRSVRASSRQCWASMASAFGAWSTMQRNRAAKVTVRHKQTHGTHTVAMQEHASPRTTPVSTRALQGGARARTFAFRDCSVVSHRRASPHLRRSSRRESINSAAGGGFFGSISTSSRKKARAGRGP